MARSSSPAPRPGVGWPSTSARPTIPDGCRGRSPTGSRCRRVRRWSASATAGASLSAWSVAIRTHCCSRRPWRASVQPPSTGSGCETEVLRAVAVIEGEAELAWELFLSLLAVRERLAQLEANLDVRTAGDAVARTLRESL